MYWIIFFLVCALWTAGTLLAGNPPAPNPGGGAHLHHRLRFPARALEGVLGTLTLSRPP